MECLKIAEMVSENRASVAGLSSTGPSLKGP